MADAVTVQIQNNAYRNAQVLLTNISDGVGEAKVEKVNATATGPYGVRKGGRVYYPGIHLSIWKIAYTIKDMAVQLWWDADTDTTAQVLAAGTDELDYSSFGGLRVPLGLAGATGSILLSTIGAAANSTYNIMLFLKKNVPAS